MSATKYPVLTASLPGTGRQYAQTKAVEFPEAYVINCSSGAILLRFPLMNREEWIARSQVCGKAEDGTTPDITPASMTGDHGTVRVPLFIAKKWLGSRT